MDGNIPYKSEGGNQKNIDLNNKVILVTGATSGIGRQIAISDKADYINGENINVNGGILLK